MVVFKASTLAIVFLFTNTTRYCYSTAGTGSKGKEPAHDSETSESSPPSSESDDFEKGLESEEYSAPVGEKRKNIMIYDFIFDSSSSQEKRQKLPSSFLVYDLDTSESSPPSSESSPPSSESSPPSSDTSSEPWDEPPQPSGALWKIGLCEGPTDGLKNYKESYKNTSLEEMRTKFGMDDLNLDDTENDLDSNTRLILRRYYLNDGYFSCLNDNNGIDENNITLPLDFCKDESKSVHAKLIDEGKEVTYDQILEFCKLYVSKLFFSHDIKSIRSKKGVIDNLYNSWSYNKLKYETFISSNFDLSSSSETEEMKKLYFESFPLAYFKLIGDLVENLVEEQGKFLSIEEYCSIKGEEVLDFVDSY